MKVVISASSGISLLNFRGSLIKEIIKRGHEVICISIEPIEEMKEIIDELKVKYVQIKCDRVGTNPFKDLFVLREYKKKLKEINPDLYFAYMSKPVAYGGYAANKLKIKNRVYLVNGLENAYYRKDLKSLFLRLVLNLLYKYAFKGANSVIFQNEDDKLRFKKIYKKTPSYVVKGSGVDLEKFVKTDMPNQFTATICARLLWSKGIREFISAAKKVKEVYPTTRFVIVGGYDINQEAIKKDEMELLISNGIIEYAGHQKDVLTFLKGSSVFVLPSYHEGIPRSVLEAMAVGRPIITTRAPGCKETVIDGYNGYLVDVGDSEAIAKRLIELINNREKLIEMGENSFSLCKKEFSTDIINNQMIKIMNL